MLAAATSWAMPSYAGEGDDPEEDMMHGSINYPFVGPSRPLGGPSSGRNDKLIVRSAVGNMEFQIEVPSALDNMDVEIPIAPLGASSGTSSGSAGSRPQGLSNPSSADRELIGSLPQIDDKYPSETGVLDKAFGTGPAGGYRQSPSYVMGIAKVNEHYRRREYEYAMVELNNLLAFYPNSPKLQKMKGTVLVRTGNLELAERAWVRAQQLEPDDAGLNRGLKQLQQRVAASKKIYGNKDNDLQTLSNAAGQPAAAPIAAPPMSPPQSQPANQAKGPKPLLKVSNGNRGPAVSYPSPPKAPPVQASGARKKMGSSFR